MGRFSDLAGSTVRGSDWEACGSVERTARPAKQHDPGTRRRGTSRARSAGGGTDMQGATSERRVPRLCCAVALLRCVFCRSDQCARRVRGAACVHARCCVVVVVLRLLRGWIAALRRGEDTDRRGAAKDDRHCSHHDDQDTRVKSSIDGEGRWTVTQDEGRTAARQQRSKDLQAAASGTGNSGGRTARAPSPVQGE